MKYLNSRQNTKMGKKTIKKSIKLLCFLSYKELRFYGSETLDHELFGDLNNGIVSKVIPKREQYLKLLNNQVSCMPPKQKDSELESEGEKYKLVIRLKTLSLLKLYLITNYKEVQLKENIKDYLSTSEDIINNIIYSIELDLYNNKKNRPFYSRIGYLSLIKFLFQMNSILMDLPTNKTTVRIEKGKNLRILKLGRVCANVDKIIKDNHIIKKKIAFSEKNKFFFIKELNDFVDISLNLMLDFLKEEKQQVVLKWFYKMLKEIDSGILIELPNLKIPLECKVPLDELCYEIISYGINYYGSECPNFQFIRGFIDDKKLSFLDIDGGNIDKEITLLRELTHENSASFQPAILLDFKTGKLIGFGNQENNQECQVTMETFSDLSIEIINLDKGYQSEKDKMIKGITSGVIFN